MKYKFSELFSDATKDGKKIPKNEYLAKGKFPIIDQGKDEIGGYCNNDEGLYDDVPAIIFGDHTRALKYIATPFFLGADGVKLLKPKKLGNNEKYLFYALKNVNVPDTGYNRHFKWIKQAQFDIPNRLEQNLIVKRLDMIERLIALRQSERECLDSLVKSRFIEMFGDPFTNNKELPIEPLGKHIELLHGFAFKSTGFLKSGIPVLRIGNINAGYFKADNLPFWKYDQALNRYLLYPGDLVISLTGTVGKDDYGNICRLGNEYEKYYLNQRNAKLILKETMLPEFLTVLLKDKRIKNKITNAGVGVRQANITNRAILEIEIPIPTIDGQNRFAAFVHQADKSKLAIQKSLDELETLKKSLMQQYFE